MDIRLTLPAQPLGLNSNDEAVELTERHFSIVRKFVEEVADIADGMLLTGSTAWGAYCAITPASDVDLLIVSQEISKLERILEKYIHSGLIDISERERFSRFKDLHSKGGADQFSIVSRHKSVPVSLDFMTFKIAEKISGLSPIREITYKYDGGEIGLRTVKEFRSNRSRADGYELGDLSGRLKITYHPKYTEVKADDGSILGYLADTLVDAVPEGQGYFLGIMSFFLCIEPVVLIDRSGRLSELIRLLQANIARAMRWQEPGYIIRQERMSGPTLEKVKKRLSERGSDGRFMDQKSNKSPFKGIRTR